MSLWDKWERERLEKEGIQVERPHGVDIRPTREKKDIRMQAWILFGAFLACIAIVFVALTLEALINGRRWSDTYVIRLLAEKEVQRQSLSDR